MPLQPHRTRSLRRVKVKLPGGRVTIHYIKRKPNQAHCANCKKILRGVPKDLPVKIRKLPKSQRRPERLFGGFLCPSCAKNEIIKKFNTVNEKIETGRLVVKTAGRESGKLGVIVDTINDTYVLLDGQVRRKKCNINHIETLDKKIKIKPNASTETVIKELKELGIEVIKTKSKPEKEKPMKKINQKKKIQTIENTKKEIKVERPKKVQDNKSKQK